MRPADVPRSDRPDAGTQPRAVQFRTNTPDAQRRGFLRRRGFLGVLGAGAMTLGITMLGWIPLARPARAEPGTEYPDCGRYSNGPGGPICLGARYSTAYCGDDNWFITGCYPRANGHRVCFSPAAICRAAGPNERRNAWRWMYEGIQYRCADGHAYWDGAPNPEVVICSAKLTPAPSSPTPPEPPAPPSPTPPPGPPTFPTLPAVPALPDLSNLPLLPR